MYLCHHYGNRNRNYWKMSKEDDKKPTVNQWAWILNYQPKIEHQHIHMGNQPENEEEPQRKNAEEAGGVEEKDQFRGNTSSLSVSRQAILDHLLDLADKGDWIKDNIADKVKVMLKTVLGQGETPLKSNEVELSATLWKLLESGRSERLRVTWQNIVGYFDDNHLLKQKTAPALNMDFFGDKIGSDNINKGRPSRDNMSSGFREILPLLDAYIPKVDKKA